MSDAARPLVLVIDDVAGNRILAEAMLRRIGWDVVVFDNAAAALDHMETCWPQAMLIDVRMPGLTGDALAALLRALPNGRSLRLIGYTAHALPDELAQLRQCGFDEVLVKPAQLADLQRVLPLVPAG